MIKIVVRSDKGFMPTATNVHSKTSWNLAKCPYSGTHSEVITILSESEIMYYRHIMFEILT